MRTEYCFTVDGAQLVFTRRAEGYTVTTVNYRDEYGRQQLCSCWVDEGDLARRTFMNHFGDDSSWPPGWWDRIGRPQFTRLHWRTPRPPRPPQFTRKSWEQENYPPSKVSWQSYFGVPLP